jgi:hypothetical protein
MDYIKVFENIDSQFADVNRENPQHMSHCFMTGRQCIFGSQLNQISTSSKDSFVGHEIFVVTPFRPNLDTFYEWCLLPYIQESFPELPIDLIRRADQFRNIGYVMCGKVCRRIQASRLVVVDITLNNANVFYELGLAVGLNKPLVLLCEDSAFEKGARKRLLRGIGIDNETKVVRYPNLSNIEKNEHPIIERVVKVELPPRHYEMKLCSLIVPSHSKDSNDDITVNFASSIEAAARISIERIEKRARSIEQEKNKEKKEIGYLEQKLVDAINALTEEQRKSLKKSNLVNLYDEANPQPYETIAKNISSSFATIIDLASENILSYFWLGFCHASGLNVIPIYRKVLGDDTHFGAEAQEATEGMSSKKGVLAFDIRALWYMDYTSGRPSDISNMLGAVLEELMIKDVMTQQRRSFWGRLAKSGKLHIYTGAIHHGEINREMVGDWDLRTVSELVRYLSSADEPIVPKLERPIYAPETIQEKLDVKWTDDYLKAYLGLVAEELKDKNCLIVASADVNPLTEVLLWKAYETITDKKIEPFPRNKNADKDCDRRIVVSLKKGNSATKAKNYEMLRFFSKVSDLVDEKKRGFLIDGEVCQRKYNSQDQNFSKFDVLGHLMIIKNPFSTEDNNIIVLLNGVSGPGTFGLAEVLTGGETRDKVINSEKILKDINRVWEQGLKEVYSNIERNGNESNKNETSGNKMKFIGVEAFLDITIAQTQQKEDKTSGEEQSEQYGKVKDKFFDKRQVTNWELLNEKKIKNPRALIELNMAMSGTKDALPSEKSSAISELNASVKQMEKSKSSKK